MKLAYSEKSKGQGLSVVLDQVLDKGMKKAQLQSHLCLHIQIAQQKLLLLYSNA